MKKELGFSLALLALTICFPSSALTCAQAFRKIPIVSEAELQQTRRSLQAQLDRLKAEVLSLGRPR